MRVVKSFAAEPRQLDRFRGSVARVFDQSMDATRIRAFYNPFIGFLPNLGLAVILLVGGRQVVNGSLTLGDFTAFYAYLLMLIAPMRQLGDRALAWPSARPPPARGCSSCSTASRSSSRRRRRGRCPRAAGGSSCAT